MNIMFGDLPLTLAASGSIEIKDVICVPYSSSKWDENYHRASQIISKMTKGAGWYYVFGSKSSSHHKANCLLAGLLYYDGSQIWGNLDGLYTDENGGHERYSYCGASGEDSPEGDYHYYFAPTSSAS